MKTDTSLSMDTNENVSKRSSAEDIKELEDAIEDVNNLMKMFFSNRFSESKALGQAKASESLYHSLGISYFTFVFALVTIERPLIAEAIEACKKSMDCCERKRKKVSLISNLFSAPNYNDYTDEEAHAELCYAECCFMLTTLTFLSEPTFVVLIKAALRIRTCNNTFKFCEQLMKSKTNWTSLVLKENFQCGVYLGIGGFNLLLSHLPSRLLKIISLVGFSANRDLALDYLHRSADTMRGLYRARLTNFVLGAYTFYAEQFFGLGAADLDWIERLNGADLEELPSSGIYLFWSGRIHQLRGNFPEAIKNFKKTLAAQLPGEIEIFNNAVYWDLGWTYALQGDWTSASECALYLEKNCAWSPATHAYQRACFQYALMEEAGNVLMKADIEECMSTVPGLRTRYAGKTIPPEKFAISKAQRFLDGDQDCVLPAYELFYIWNVFSSTGGQSAHLDPILEKINKKLTSLNRSDEKFFVATFLKGVCLRSSGRGDEAIECFQDILQNQEDIKVDTYVPPHAAFELGLSYLDIGRHSEAKEWLERARDSYTGFLAESLVHLRIHGALTKVKQLKGSK